MILTVANGDVGAKTGVTLGGASIINGFWNGKWSNLNVCTNAKTDIAMAAASAVVVRLPLRE